MNVLCKVLKDPEKKRGRDEKEKELEERKRLTTSLHETEKAAIFQEYKAKDILKDLQTRDLIIREKERQIEALLPLHQKNEQLVGRLRELEEKLIAQVRLNQALESRLQKQVDDLGKVHQRRIEDARAGAMNSINEHIQLLQILFQKYITDPKLREEALAAFIVSMDAIRTAVGINLI
jgi:hypothetical protein